MQGIKGRFWQSVFYVFLLVLLAGYLFPFFWMVLASLKSQLQNMAVPPLFIFSPTFDNYSKIFSEYPFVLFLWNSSVVGFGSAGIGLLLGIPAAYAIARYKSMSTPASR